MKGQIGQAVEKFVSTVAISILTLAIVRHCAPRSSWLLPTLVHQTGPAVNDSIIYLNDVLKCSCFSAHCLVATLRISTCIEQWSRRPSEAIPCPRPSMKHRWIEPSSSAHFSAICQKTGSIRQKLFELKVAKTGDDTCRSNQMPSDLTQRYCSFTRSLGGAIGYDTKSYQTKNECQFE